MKFTGFNLNKHIMAMISLVFILTGCGGDSDDDQSDNASFEGTTFTLDGFPTIKDTSLPRFVVYEFHSELGNRDSEFQLSVSNAIRKTIMGFAIPTVSKDIIAGDKFDLTGQRLIDYFDGTRSEPEARLFVGADYASSGTIAITAKEVDKFSADVDVNLNLNSGGTIETSGTITASGLDVLCFVATNQPENFESVVQPMGTSWAWGHDKDFKTDYCRKIAGMPPIPDPVACTPTQDDLVSGRLGDLAVMSRSLIKPGKHYLNIDITQLAEIDALLAANPGDPALAVAASVVPTIHLLNQGPKDACDDPNIFSIQFDYAGSAPPNFATIDAQLVNMQSQLDSLSTLVEDAKKEAAQFLFQSIFCPTVTGLYDNMFSFIPGAGAAAAALHGC